jgi:DNA-binding phage protein
MDPSSGGEHPQTIGLSLARGVAELGELLRQTDPDRSAAFLEGAIMADANDLGEQLREAIRASGLTVYAIAQESGVDTGPIYRFMSGERSISLETAAKLAAVFGMRFTKPRRRTGGG